LIKGVNIVRLFDDEHRGDNSNVAGTSFELQKLCKEQLPISCDSYSFKTDDIHALVQFVNNHTNYLTIMLLAGEHEIPIIKDIKSKINSENKVYISWSAHQLSNNITELVDYVDSVALPSHVLTKDNHNFFLEGKIKLIETVGVPHDLRKETLEKEYYLWKDTVPTSSKYEVVVLGGDAPDQNGKMHYFSKEEARDFGEYIATHRNKEAVLLVVNGPRTGKHDPSTGKILDSHFTFDKYNREVINYKLDEVSCAFKGALTNNNLIEDKDFKFFDFKFYPDRVINAYYGLLGFAIFQTVKKFFIPGDSISTISEVIDFFSNHSSIIIYTHRGMSESHKDFLNSISQSKNITIISEGKEVVLDNQCIHELNGMTAAQVLAGSIFEDIKPLLD
jgi:hypothetical protein